MFFDGSVRFMSISGKLAQLIGMLRDPEGHLRVAEDLGQITGLQVVLEDHPQTDDNPRWTLTRFGDTAVILIGGASSQILGIKSWRGFFFPKGEAGQPLKNGFCSDVADVIQQRMISWLPEVPRHMIFAGWSAGGVIATYLATAWQAPNPRAQVSLATFGEPRAANRTYWELDPVSDHIRWMTQDDPIPLLPPRFAEFPAGPLAFGPVAFLGINRFTHGPGGAVLSFDQPPRQAETDGSTGLSSMANFGAWWFSQETDPTTPHSIQNYQNRISQWTRPGERGSGEAPLNERVEPLDTRARREITIAGDQVATNVNLIAERQNKQEAVQPPGALFSHRRAGRVYYVTFGGEDVAIAGRKRRAEGLAAAGNDFLGRLQRQPLVDVAALGQQFIAYLQAASSDAGGFVPPLSTSL